jgi:D-glycero-alpha-D-manno-heptose-7-phosphate kinase
MIISRTPFRISFFGGGTDYPAWCKDNPGASLATTIDKYCYITTDYLPPFFECKYRIVYSKREMVKKLSEIDHPSVRESLKFLNIKRGVSIQHVGDLPARAGIGSSSAFTVGLLNSLYALKGKIVTKRQLAMDAIEVEQDWIKENVGYQDQVITSFGGLNKIEFNKGGKNIEIIPMTFSNEKIDFFQKHLMLFFTGFTRTASEIASEQIKKIPQNKKELKVMYEMVQHSIDLLNDNDSFDSFGRLLHESWEIKRTLSSKISTPVIDDIYQSARRAGAIGGKLLGAGGGGFLLFFVKPESQPKVKAKLKNLLHVPFKFDDLGSQIIYYKPDTNF